MSIKLEELTDSELMSLYLEGNAGSFNTFYERHGKKLYNFIRKVLSDYKDEAEDITQAVWDKWLQLCLSGEKTSDELSAALLFTIGKNKAIEHYRKFNRMSSLESIEEDDTSSSLQLIDENEELADNQSALIWSVYQVIEQKVNQVRAALKAADNEFGRAKLTKEYEKISNRAEQLKQVFDMSWMGYSRDKISAAIGLSVDVVRYREQELHDLLKASDISI